MQQPRRFLLIAIIVVFVFATGFVVTIYELSERSNTSVSVTQGSYQEQPITSKTLANTPTGNIPSNPITETGYVHDYNYTTGPAGNVVSEQLVFVSPQKVRIVVPVAIAERIDEVTRFQVTQQKNGESLNAGISPISPLDKNQIIIATNDTSYNPDGTYKSVNRLYSYNLHDSGLNLLATFNSISGTGGGTELIIIATDGAKIVLAPHIIGTGGPCSNFWADFDHYYYFDLSDQAAGLQTYNVPEPITTAAKEEQVKCQQSL